MKDLLKTLRGAAEKATPGPVNSIRKGLVNAAGKQIWHMSGQPGFESQAKKDVEYYALCSPENILTLITELERLREMEREAREVIELYTEDIRREVDAGKEARQFLSKWAAPVEEKM